MVGGGGGGDIWTVKISVLTLSLEIEQPSDCQQKV